MTLFIVDVSRHQVERPDPLNLEDAKNVGITAVNIALDRGREEDVLPAWARAYADRARTLGLGISTYRWLDGRISGAESARRAFERMHQLGGPAGMAHSVDFEETPDKGPPATERILTDYITTMRSLLGRSLFAYSGRWYLRPKGWRVADLTSYLWAAPAVGYLDNYPGDASPHWAADYGGYQVLSAMQYAVQPLPGTGDCSLSAIRDPAVWAALTGTEVPVPTYAQLQAERWYNEELVTPEYAALHVRLRKALGVPAANVGSKGDNKHLNGGHRSQAWIENSRYCTNRTYATEPGLTAEEKRWLSASDITPNTREQMLRISQNIDKVTRAGQLEEVVEWFGNTNDDTRVDGWDNIRNAVATSDSSHLWHLHMRLKRKVLRDASVMDRVFNAVINGEGDDDMKADERNWLENVYNATFFGGVSMGAPVDDKVNDGSGNSLVDVLQHTRARIDAMATDLAALKAAPLTVTDAQVAQLAAALVADVDTPLGPEDSPVIEAAVKKALRDLVDPS